MRPGPDAQRNRTRLLVWWIVWAASLITLLAIQVGWFHGRPPPPGPAAGAPLAGLAGVVPLFVSIVVRWLVLPRYTEMNRAFVLFLFGVALAESCGILGLVLGGPYRDQLFVLGVLGVAQYLPFFARTYLEPKPRGYIPNN